MRLSANLGFLWSELALPDAIRAAKTAGFDAVECHWPHSVPSDVVAKALAETGLKMLGLNTRRGNIAAGENGLAALPDREQEAREYIDEALAYARATRTSSVHVMAGVTQAPEAYSTFTGNLAYACTRAKPDGITILIEPLNRFDAPGYFLENTRQAADIIREVGAPNLRLMFDCYHVERTEGRVLERLGSLHDIIGHIQFASVPDRGPPDCGSLDYATVFAAIRSLGWQRPIGAEYKPNGPTDATLGWMERLR